MKKDKGITLITVIITVVLLAIMVGLVITYGIDTFEKSKVVKFETNMKTLQKKVDLSLEEGIDYTTLGSGLSTNQKKTLQTILDNDSNNYIETDDASLTTLRYFSSTDIQEDFGIENIDDEIVVNFANREVISLNGVEKDEVMHYVEYGLH